MIDREQVKYDIERCISHVPDACVDCSHYWGKKDGDVTAIDCMEELLAEAHTLLKEQEPLPVRYVDQGDSYPPCIYHSVCRACGGILNYPEKFCKACGRGVIWVPFRKEEADV